MSELDAVLLQLEQQGKKLDGLVSGQQRQEIHWTEVKKDIEHGRLELADLSRRVTAVNEKVNGNKKDCELKETALENGAERALEKHKTENAAGHGRLWGGIVSAVVGLGVATWAFLTWALPKAGATASVMVR